MAEMKRCEQCGKFYNLEKDASCPYCSGTASSVDKTLPVMTNAVIEEEKIMPTVSITKANDDEKTMPVFHVETKIDPVVGWLVCLSGSEKGKDFKIHFDNNYIGRSEKMDICIQGDETVSRENHAIITYDNRDKVFYFTPGTGRNIVRLNGKALMMTSEIKAYDKVELGTTEFVFIPLCGENFDWSDSKREE